MEVFNTPSKIIITCNRRLSPYLQGEIRQLGFEIKRGFATGVELSATVNDCIRLNLNLHCASQVLYSLHSFTASNPDELYEALSAIPWEDLIAFDGYVSVTSNVNNPTISTPLFANLKVKDAIADRIKSKKGLRPNSGPDLHKTVVHLYWQDDQAEVFLDTSGETLAKHGYRKHPGKAPMLEALAAGVVYATAWDGQSAFVNPMCGSGTLAIEAALIATNRKPGLFRMNYAFMHIIGYDEQVFFAERRKLKEQVNKKTAAKIIASDLSKDAIDIALMNAKTAGVDQLIDFHVCDFADTPLPAGTGLVVFNPEYGERLGVHTKLEATYSRIGDFLKQQCGGKRGYVFTGNPDLAKKIGLHTSRRVEFYNGKLDCRLLEYEIYAGSRRAREENTD
ncbi:RNA methyltransferase [Parapedobacter pyrenivorans]|uniref:RNA methyltransferase n=1 Tax=Parapedobacter pyrenivorans TaxID=1305674 RepID=A0A917HNV1_9SPHI|nr:class I SAM-dependent RNA methyltransferase [Parapedobacter pyrenivorans]GGG84447.1 RNA methyltransferase [Parapedobacter pyrenivorans]